jgi:hypothetical protein
MPSKPHKKSSTCSIGSALETPSGVQHVWFLKLKQRWHS